MNRWHASKCTSKCIDGLCRSKGIGIGQRMVSDQLVLIFKGESKTASDNSQMVTDLISPGNKIETI
jgi:hypothetical protein